MSADDVLRTALVAAIGLGAFYALIGGLMTRVSGRWRDGDRVITLRQFGPFVSGQATRPGGWERYSGFAAGLGVERFCMVRHGIDDIRRLYTSDLRFLEQF